MSLETINLTAEVYRYLQTVSLREPPVLQALRAETKKLSAARMQISPEQGQLMGLLIQLLNAKKTLDIGTFTGYSALVVALSMSQEGRVVACDVSKEWTSIAKKFWQAAQVENKIELHLQPALKTLDGLLAAGEANTFDFAFIDADKKNYPEYYEKALSLLRPGGLIAIDNVLWDGKVADAANNEPETCVIRDLNAKIHADNRVDISLIPIGDGLTLARKKERIL